MSQSLKKTFITTVLTAVKKNKQPTHTPGGPGRLRSWSGPVETDFQGRPRFSSDNRPEHRARQFPVQTFVPITQRGSYLLDTPLGINFPSLTKRLKERERVCCLLVLNSVTSTPQWIRQPEAAWGCVWCLCVSMYSDILGSLSL